MCKCVFWLGLGLDMDLICATSTPLMTHGLSCTHRQISNLDFKVTDEDIKELFEPFSGLKFSTVHWDSRYSSATSEQNIMRELTIAAVYKL